MKSVICDTNIWYSVANKKINESRLKDLHLYGTAVNILEISSTPNLIKNIELIVRVVKSMNQHHYLIIKTNPMEHLIVLFNKDYVPDGNVEERLLNGFSTLMNIDTKKIPIENIKKAKKQINKILATQHKVADQINNRLPNIREEIKRKGGKKRHRKIDFTDTWKKFISELVSIYSKEHCDKEYILDIKDKTWENLEFFIYTWESYFKILEIENRKFDKNDWADLFNLVYVQPGFKYWTLEKKWNRIFKENEKLSKYLYDYNDI